MSIHTAIRKKGGNGSGYFLSMMDISNIRHWQEVDNSKMKRRQKFFDKHNINRKACRQMDVITNWSR